MEKNANNNYGPVNQERKPTRIAQIVLTPSPDEAYNIKYLPEGKSSPLWDLRMDKAGNVSNLRGITEDSFIDGLEILIDPDFPPDSPSLKRPVINVSQSEGDFELPDAKGWWGTLVNKNIYVESVSIFLSDTDDTNPLVDSLGRLPWTS